MKQKNRRLRFENLENRSLMATSDGLLADLWVDADRDGDLDVQDNAGEDRWTAGPTGRGAIVLPNLDRDNTRTDAPDNWTGGFFNGSAVPPNNIIDNAADLLDIGRIRLNKLDTDASYEYRLTIRILKPLKDPAWFADTPATDRVRIFLPTRQLENGDTVPQAGDVAVIGPGLGDTIRFVLSPNGPNEFSIRDLAGKGGYFLGIEGLKSGANVRIEATLQFAPLGTDGPPPKPTVINRDTVEVKVAPFVLQDNRQEVTNVIVENLNRYNLDNSDLRNKIQEVFGNKTIVSRTGDLWQQDGYEIGYVQAPYGQMTVVLDLPRGRDGFFDTEATMRTFIRGQLLRPGIGVNTDLAGMPVVNNSTFGGDIESVALPGAQPGEPGMLVMSNMPSYMRQYFAAQGVNKSLNLSLEWLGVNHVDEVIQMAPDGKKVLIADPDLAWALLMLAVKLDPTVRLHPKMNGNDALPGYTSEGILGSVYLGSEKLRSQNLEYVQRAGNLGGVYRTVKQTFGLTDEVSPIARGFGNQGTINLRKAGIFTQMLGNETRQFRIQFTSADNYNLQYRDSGAWSQTFAGKVSRDEVFPEAKAFLFKNYWTGTAQAGDVITFQSVPDATLIKMPVMFSSAFLLTDAGPANGVILPDPKNPRVGAFSVNHINSLVDTTTVISGKAYGPKVNWNGTGKRDLFQDYATKVFQKAGYTRIEYVDSTLYHDSSGSLHCGTNTIRRIPIGKWYAFASQGTT